MKPNKLESLLVSKFGFAAADNKSDDHRYYQLLVPSLPLIQTKVSHGKKDIGPKLLGRIARQLRVRGPFLEEMVACTKSAADYLQQLRDDPFPPFDIRF